MAPMTPLAGHPGNQLIMPAHGAVEAGVAVPADPA